MAEKRELVRHNRKWVRENENCAKPRVVQNYRPFNGRKIPVVVIATMLGRIVVLMKEKSHIGVDGWQLSKNMDLHSRIRSKVCQ